MRNVRRRKTSSTLISVSRTYPSEHDEQVGFINWFRTKFPKVLIFAIPNGGKRSISAGKKFKAEGVVAGVPDLFIPEWNLWVEMKRESGGRLSPDQKEMIAYLERIGHCVVVGKGARDASKQIMDFKK